VSEEGQAAEVARLLALGAPTEHKGGDRKWTPLMTAAERGHIEVVILLVDGGANLEARNIWGWTALMRASINGRLAIVKLLSDKG